MRRAGGFVGVGLVDGNDLIDRIGDFVHQRIFSDAGMPHRYFLEDIVTGLERMHREPADVFHAAADMSIERAVPDEGGLFGVLREAFAQREELQLQLFAENRLGIGQDRAFGIDAAGQREGAECSERCAGESLHSAASLPWPSRVCSVLSSFSAASEITVPGGKIASQPAFIKAP